MTATPNEFQLLLERARAGDQAAAAEFHRLYSGHILRIVRRRLRRNPVLQRVVGGSDCAQEVLKKFFTDWIYKRHFLTPQQLVAYLTRAAESTVREKERQYLHAKKRDLRRQEPLATPAAGEEAVG